jgi:hypothetical protein
MHENPVTRRYLNAALGDGDILTFVVFLATAQFGPPPLPTAGRPHPRDTNGEPSLIL